MDTDVTVEVVHQSHHSIPFSRNPRFTGRSHVLDELEKKLFNTKDCSAMAIVGLGGMGKTQVALHFAYRIQELYPEHSIFWVVLVSDGTFEQSVVDIARRLGLREKNADKAANVKKMVCDYLNSRSAGKWLLIVDNADDRDIVYGSGQRPGIIKYLPKSENGRVLMTTRSREVATDFTQSDFILLNEMNVEDSEELLRSSLMKTAELPDGELVRDLVNDLAYLPLAITQAAAYLNRTGMPIQNYLDLLRRAEHYTVRLLGQEFKDSSRYHDAHNAITTTWLVSFEQISRSSTHAVNLLYFLSCIEPKAIPQSILPDPHSMETEEAIALLCGYLFLVRRRMRRESPTTFDMHSLVHIAVRLWRDQHNDTEQASFRTISHLANIFPDDNWSSRNIWRLYLPHAFRALGGSRAHDTRSRCDLLNKVGLCLSSDGRFEEAVTYHEEACRWATAPENKDVQLRYSCQSELALIYGAVGRYNLAVGILEPLVSLMREMRQRTDPERVAAEHKLATVYIVGGRIKEAIELLQPLFETRAEIRFNHQSRMELDLALAYLKVGEIQRSIEIAEYVIEHCRRGHEMENPLRLAAENLLAEAYVESGRVQEAIKLLESVVRVRQEIEGKEDHRRQTSEYHLAKAYLDDGQSRKAIDLLEPLVETQGRMLGQDDNLRLASQYALAKAYIDGGDAEKGVRLFETTTTAEKELELGSSMSD